MSEFEQHEPEPIVAAAAGSKAVTRRRSLALRNEVEAIVAQFSEEKDSAPLVIEYLHNLFMLLNSLGHRMPDSRLR